ncbi:MAG: hypothetical protein A3H98_02260 [Bacteroidetes bacterium RIFCSPLOWO2_02_FULL_36_8]|nr:MAG: hypothetical protein A3H98_02260 [Bacteroidetes bacterium RIFCSPLOWO2_02_FULL_36_8]OFY69185.1 MAG: hypothetical protein A3G23_06460 [Bacteroidetes bacterium RIFCSPLOWO2_12_FULL_37_12]
MFIFLLSAFVLINSGFDNKIDSLEHALNKTEMHDTTRINTLNELAWELRITERERASEYSRQAMVLAEKTNFKKGIEAVYRTLASLNYNQGNYSMALEYHFKTLKLAEELGNKTEIAAILGNIGLVYKEQANFPNALKYFFEALKKDEEQGNKKGIARHLGNLGNVYNTQADYPKALSYYFRSLKMKEDLGDKEEIAKTLGNIGAVYLNQLNHSKALKYYFRALKIGEELGDKKGIALRLGNIGIVYYDQADYTKAIDYYFRALKVAEELGDKNRIAIWLGNIGNVYNKKAVIQKTEEVRASLFKKAVEYYLKALEMDEDLAAKNLIVINLGNLGALYITTGKFKEAEEILKRSLAIADTIGSLDDIRVGHQHLTRLYDTTGRTLLAFEHYKKYCAAKDSIFNEEKSKDIGKLEMQHELEIAEFERQKRAEEETRLAKIEKVREDKIGYSFILIAVLALLGGVTLLVRISIPQSLLQIATTVPFLLLFETVIVFMNPYIEQFAANDPAWKLGSNFLLSLVIYPIHERVERFVRRRVGRVTKKTPTLYR